MQKSLISLIVAIVAVASLLFLPLISIGDLNFFDLIELEIFFEDFTYLLWLLALMAGAGAIVAAIKKDRNITFLVSTVAASAMLLSLICVEEGASEILGPGFWFAFIAFAANSILTHVFAKEW